MLKLRDLANLSIPFFTTYWISIFRWPSHHVNLPRRLYRGHSAFKRLEETHGRATAFLLSLLFSSALKNMDWVEASVLRHGSDPMAFRKALISDFAALGLTAAIITQVSITALSLPKLDQTHWTSHAAFVISLVLAIISAWDATTMARTMSSLDNADDLRDWLSKPAPRKAQHELRARVQKRLRRVTPISEELHDSVRHEIRVFIEEHKWQEPSLFSAIMLSWPAVLLNLSLACFLLALGIYVGSIWKERLGDSQATLAVLVCFILSASGGLIIHFGSANRKDAESELLRTLIVQFDQLSNTTALAPAAKPGED
jgi:hypothetical protein